MFCQDDFTSEDDKLHSVVLKANKLFKAKIGVDSGGVSTRGGALDENKQPLQG